MNHTSVRNQLEQEKSWRLSELVFFENQARTVIDPEQQRVFRKALVVLLYSHLEGFCTNAFTIYLDEVNRTKLRVCDICWPLSAAALEPEFDALRNTDKKSKIFKKQLPDDSKLHRFAREQDFIEAIDGISSRTFVVEPEQIIDCESNLKPVVLKKLLFRVGLDLAPSEKWAGTLNKLLNYRNAIAHGARKDGLDEAEYTSLRADVVQLTEEILTTLHDAAVKAQHLRPPPKQ